MSVNVYAAAVTAKLLESDLNFVSNLTTDVGTLEIMFQWEARTRNYVEASANLRVEWTAEIVSESYGIREIKPIITALKLEGELKEDKEDMSVEVIERFNYSYPDDDVDLSHVSTHSDDPDMPSDYDIKRELFPEWKLKVTVEGESDSEKRTQFFPRAEVDIHKHRIEITF